MMENCKNEDIDYTKPIIVKWWQSNGYYRVNKYEIVNGEAHLSTLTKCDDFSIPELDCLRDRVEHIQDNLYWLKHGKYQEEKKALEYLLTHPDNIGIITNNFDTSVYE